MQVAGIGVEEVADHRYAAASGVNEAKTGFVQPLDPFGAGGMNGSADARVDQMRAAASQALDGDIGEGQAVRAAGRQ